MVSRFVGYKMLVTSRFLSLGPFVPFQRLVHTQLIDLSPVGNVVTAIHCLCLLTAVHLLSGVPPTGYRLTPGMCFLGSPDEKKKKKRDSDHDSSCFESLMIPAAQGCSPEGDFKRRVRERNDSDLYLTEMRWILWLSSAYRGRGLFTAEFTDN